MTNEENIMSNLDDCYREICKSVKDEESELALDTLIGINLLRQRVALEIELSTLKSQL